MTEIENVVGKNPEKENVNNSVKQPLFPVTLNGIQKVGPREDSFAGDNIAYDIGTAGIHNAEGKDNKTGESEKNVGSDSEGGDFRPYTVNSVKRQKSRGV